MAIIVILVTVLSVTFDLEHQDYCIYISIDCMLICNKLNTMAVRYAKPYRTHLRKVYSNIIIYTSVNVQTEFTHVLIIVVVFYCMFYFPNISDPNIVV
jgi:hypothetical protein